MKKNKSQGKVKAFTAVGTHETELSFNQWLMCVFVIIMPLLFCKWNDQSPFEMIKAYFSTEVIAILSLLFLGKLYLTKTITIRWNAWILGLVGYICIYFVCFAFASHYYSSFWGVLNLPAGSVMTVTTFVIFSFLITQYFNEVEDLKTLASSVVICTFLMSVYGIVQHFGGDPINWWVYNAMTSRALSTMGQSVGYGTVVGCALPLCFVFLILAESLQAYLFWIFAWICMNMGILYSGSRLPIFAYFLTMLFFLGFILIFKKRLPFVNIKKVLLAFALMGVCNLVYFNEPGDNAIKSRLEVSELKGAYSTRFLVWRTGFELWKKHPILGVGPENFGEEFNHIQTIEQNYGESWNLIWHKAHNEFVHYLVTTGLLGILAYLSLIVLMFVPVAKIILRPVWKKEYLYSVALLGGFGFLLVTHMTAFSFIPTLMFFYLFPAMNFSFAGLVEEKEFENSLGTKWAWGLTAFTVLLIGAGMYKVYAVWQADVDYNESRRQLVNYGNFDKSGELLDSALAQNPDNAEYWCFRSDVYYNYLVRTLRQQPATPELEQQRRKFFDEIISSSDQCIKRDPRKSDLWRARGTLFLSMSQFAPNLVDGSLDAFKKAVEVYPNNPFNFISIAGVYRKKGRDDLAIESLFTAISKRRDILPAYNDLLTIYYDNKRTKDIQELVNSIRALSIPKGTEFYNVFPALIKTAESHGDKSTADQIKAIYEASPNPA